MTSTADAAPTSDTIASDPTKHVNYTLGMILGADDFDQEFAWLSGRDHWALRDAIGYGTLNGLQVQAKLPPEVPEPEVRVSCGTAITPRGDLVRVPAAQCARLDPWLQRHADEVGAWLASPPEDTLPVYVVLCYDDCLTDARPIPGEPCRDEKDMMAASRVADSFRLELRL
jgi:hypothetical protein